MVELRKVLKGLPDKIMKKISDLFDKGIEEGLNADIALIRAFNPIVAGKDSYDLNEFLRRKLGNARYYEADQYKDEADKIDPDLIQNDGEFYHVPVTLTTSGVNLNGAFKSAETLKKTAKRQENWIIPSINDHMDDWVWDEEKQDYYPRIEPKDLEISGFVYGIHGVELDNGEYAVRGIDMIPMGVPDILDNHGVSIGYDAKFIDGKGEYKGSEYYYEQTDITIVHNARMIDQRPSIPPKAPEGQAFGAGYPEELQIDSSDEHGKRSLPQKPGIDREEKNGDDTMNDKDKEKDQAIETLTAERDELQVKLDSIDQKKLTDRIEELETMDKESEKKILDLETKNAAQKEVHDKDHEELDAFRKAETEKAKAEQDALIVEAVKVFKDKYTEEELRAKPMDHLKELMEIATRAPPFDKEVPKEEGAPVGPDKLTDPVGKKVGGKWVTEGDDE